MPTLVYVRQLTISLEIRSADNIITLCISYINTCCMCSNDKIITKVQDQSDIHPNEKARQCR